MSGHIVTWLARRTFRKVCLRMVDTSAIRVVYLIASLLLVSANSIRAEHLPIKTYTIADGLAHDSINRIKRDSHGYLWFCTQEGLSRFDGYTFTNYGKDQGLPGRDVNDLLETRDGVYLVATDVGVYRFNPMGRAAPGNSQMRSEQSQATKRVESSAEPMFVAYYQSGEQKPYNATALLEDHAGVIWCGTALGMYQLDRSSEQPIFRFVDMGMPVKFEESTVRSLLEDRHGALWVGTMGSGLYRHLSDGRTEHYTIQQGLPHPEVPALLEDREGHLWAGTRTGLCRLVSNPNPNQPIVEQTYTKKEGLVANYVRSLFQSADGRLWVGMFGGLSSFVPAHDGSASQFSSFTTRNGLTDVDVWAIAEDRENNLWLASTGALKMAREGFTTYGEDDGLGAVQVSSIFANQKGELCAITSGSKKKFINQFDGTKFTAVAPNLPKQLHYFGWGTNQITFQDHTGEWWVTTAEGLFRFPKVSRIEQLASIPPKAVYHTLGEMVLDEVFRLYEDSRGDIWISAFNGVKQWISKWERASDTFHNYTQADGLPIDVYNIDIPPLTTAFREDRAGNLWVGFSGKGVARFRNGRFTVFNTKDDLQAGWVKDLYLDHAGRLWISSREGLSRSDDPTAEHPRFINYTTDSGLASDSVWCITEDENHRIYIGTSRGLDRLEPDTGHIRHYTQADGLAQNEVQVAFRDSHGSLWFGTGQGLSRLDPQPDESPESLPIHISGLRINGIARPLSELGEVAISRFVLGPYENQVQIDFGGLDFGPDKDLRYQYKLEGSGADWSTPTSLRSVNFASLPAGEYRFSVMVVGPYGVMSSLPATVSFSILSPIWRRWWFLTLVLFTAALGTFSLYRYRLARLIELERVRTRIASDLHDDIGSNLSVVAGLSEVLRQRMGVGDETSNAHLAVIAKVSQRSVDAMSDIVWAINPQKDHLSDLVQRMRRFASDAFSAHNVQLVFEAPEGNQHIRLGAETRRQVFLIFKESVNNAARHSGCAKTRVSIIVTNGTLAFSVSDDGKGFDGDGVEAGEGLLSMRQRAKRIRSELIITSSSETGTTVMLRVPLVEKLL